MNARPGRAWRTRRRRLTLRPAARRGSHAWARTLLAERMDLPLPVETADALGEHLRGCARCRSVARAYEDGRRELRQMRPTVVPRDLGARVNAALDKEMTGGARVGGVRVPAALRRPAGSIVAPVAAGAVAVLLLVGGARLLLAPSGAPPSVTRGGTAGVVQPDPTPFVVPTAELALVDQGSDGLTVYRTAVSEVCPADASECAVAGQVAAQVVGLAPDLVPRGVALDRQSRRMALLAEDALGADSVSVVTLPPSPGQADPRGAGPGPDGRWPVTAPGSQTPAALASLVPATTDAPLDPASLDPDDPSAPARVLAILEGVEAVGAPPAWSPDGTMLAFSAMPIDHSRGPDIYVWRPGDARAHRATSDHRSWFASWSGTRVVLSRMPRGQGREQADTVLLDPADGTEAPVEIRGAWLPSVDPSGRFAVAWHGTLTGGLAAVRPRTGGLALIDWTLVDPAAVKDQAVAKPLAMRAVDDRGRVTRGARAAGARPSPWLETIEPATGDGPAALDWQVRWATSGTTFGYWVADAHGASWGRLTVLHVVPETRSIDRDGALLGPTLARRSFTLGEERIAWVAPADEGADGELRVRVWGLRGEGGVRLRDIRLRHGIPAF
jgi:hypothetical protein